MMNCRHCQKDVELKDGFKYCPYCGGLLENFLSTKEMDDFIIENQHMLRKDLTALFNEKFGTNKTVSAVSHRCRRLGLIMPKEVRYNHAGQATYDIREKSQIGTEKFYRNCMWVKVDEENSHHPKSIFQDPCWKRKHYLVWEEAGRTVPNGYRLMFLDGDPKNCSLDNLVCVDKRTQFAMANPYIFSLETPEAKRTAIKLCELNFAIKDVKGESND